MTGQLAPRAKPPTPEEAQKRREEMHGLLDRIKEAISDGRAAVWKLAALLDVFDENVGWSALGYESQNEWLADPDISMSRTQYHRLVDTYRFLVKNEIEPATIKQLEVTKIDAALPAVRQGRANLVDVIDDVQLLSRSDLKEKYRDPAASPSGGTDADDPAGKPKPALPQDGEPVDASELEDGAVIPVTGEDGEPLDPTGEVDDELIDTTDQGPDAQPDAETMVTDEETGEGKPVHNGELTNIGQLSPQLLGKALALRDLLDTAENAVSDAMKAHFYRETRVFLAALIGDDE